jgi:hypothetical protein
MRFILKGPMAEWFAMTKLAISVEVRLEEESAVVRKRREGSGNGRR